MEHAKALVVDVPIRPLVKREQCRWLRGNGQRCGRMAEEGGTECRWHAEWYRLLPAVFGMPYPEDAVAIQHILARTVSMVIGGEMDARKAQAVARLCEQLRKNLLLYEREMMRTGNEPIRPVTERVI